MAKFIPSSSEQIVLFAGVKSAQVLGPFYKSILLL